MQPIPRHGHLVSSVVVSTQEPLVGDETWASTKLPKIHVKLEWEMEKPRDSERQHERRLAWCV